MISFKCPKCGEGMEAPGNQRGDYLECPRCGAAVRIESPTTPAAADSPPAESAALTAAQRKEQRIQRALKMLRQSKEVLEWATQVSHLLQDICRIVVEVGGYRLAWVGLAEHDEKKTVRPIAQMGYEADYLEKVNITWSDTERGRGPTGRAIRTRQPVINRNVLENPDYRPWREEALKRGYASSIALPLISRGQVMGALNIYAARPDAFDEEEVELLMKLADDLARGVRELLAHHKRRQERETPESKDTEIS